jgi:hypothetical protein
VLAGTDDEQAYGVAHSPSGGIAAAGLFTIDITLAGMAYASTDGGDMWLARFDDGGVELWARAFSSTVPMPAPDAAYAVVAGADLVVMGGVIGAGTAFDATAPIIGGAGGADGFVAAFDDDGVYRWSRAFGSAGNEVVRDVELDADGGVVLAGWVQGETTIPGGEPLPYAGGYDGVVARLDRDGEHLWSRTFGGPGDDLAHAVAVTDDGHLLVVGYFTGSIAFDGLVLQAPAIDAVDGYVVELDASGTAVWARGFGSTAAAAYGVAVDDAGNAVVVGSAGERVDFGDGSVPLKPGVTAAFVAKFGPDGQPLWGRRFDRDGTQTLLAVLADETGVVTVGQFDDLIDFPEDVVSSQGGLDGFVLRLTP